MTDDGNKGTGVKSNAGDFSCGPRGEQPGEVPDLRADGNDDGNVNQADWQVWFNHFSRSLDVDDVVVA